MKLTVNKTVINGERLIRGQVLKFKIIKVNQKLEKLKRKLEEKSKLKQ